MRYVHKVLEFYNTGQISEVVMTEEDKNGWELVNIVPYGAPHLHLLVTFRKPHPDAVPDAHDGWSGKSEPTESNLKYLRRRTER